MSKLQKQEKKVELFKTNDDLRCYIHDIHNYLRNNGVGYGLTAMNIFSVFYGLKLIENQLDELGLSEKEKKILDYKELDRRAKAYEEITGFIDREVLDTLFEMKKNHLGKPQLNNKNKELAEFLFHEIPRDVRDDIWKELILKIDKIPVGYTGNDKVNLSGKIYEYFIGRDKTAISELGAFFTDRHIVDFIYNKIQPTLDEDNNVKTMIDPFGGSGGFTLGYADYLRKNYSDEIEWKNNVNNIYHFDMQKDVINMTGIEMFAITGIMPTKHRNYLRKNSFTNDFLNKEDNPSKYNYVVSNPPYGGDKLSKTTEYDKKNLILNKLKEQIKELEKDNTDEQTKKIINNKKTQIKTLTDEIKNYKTEQEKQFVTIKNCSDRIKAFAKKYEIDTANDKESCSLILLADLLNENGTGALVLKEGVFFDNNYSKLREVITNNYNITNIISVPQSAFENTSTKTSIIIFHNNGKTKKINFSEIVVETEPENEFEEDDNGYITVSKYKGEISKTDEKQLCFATFEQLAKPTITKGKGKNPKDITNYNYSWNYKNYKENIVYCPDGYKLVKLSDICEINPNNTKLQTNNITYVEISDIENNQIINKTEMNIKDVPNGSKRHPNKNDILLCSVRPNTSKIVYYNMYEPTLLISGAIFNLRCKQETDSVYVYNYILNNMDNYLRTMGNGSSYPRISPEFVSNIQIPIPEDISTIEPQLKSLKTLHEQITKDTELIPQKEKHIMNLIKKLTDDGVEGVDYEIKKLDECIEYQKKLKKYKAADGKANGKYKFYTSSQDKIMFIDDEPMFKDTMLIMGRKGDSSVHYDRMFSCEHDDVYVMKVINIDTRYVSYYVKNNIEWFKEQMNGSTVKGTSKEILSKFNINILKPFVMKKHKLQVLFDEVDKLKETLESNKKTYQNQMDNLFKDFKNQEKEQHNKSIQPNQIKESTYTEYPLSSFAKPIVQGKNLTETSPTKTKEYKYPYYTAQNSPENNPNYCKTASYSGQHILVTRVEQNQGTIQLVSGDFTANSDFYVIKLEDDYESYYDIIKEQLENYDFKELIEKEPIIVKIKGKDQPSKHIGLSHLNNFMVKLEDQKEEPSEEKQVESDEEQSNEKHQNEQLDESSEESIKEPKEKPKEIIQQNKIKTQPVKPLNQKVIQNAKKKNITIA